MKGKLKTNLYIKAFFLFGCVKIGTADQRRSTVQISVVLDKDERSDLMERAITYGIEVANQTDHRDQSFNLNALISRTDVEDPFILSYQFCEHLSDMVFVVLTVGKLRSYDVIQTYSQNLQMPIIVPYTLVSLKHKRSDYEISLCPSYIPAITDLIITFKWKLVYFIYDSEEHIHHLAEIKEKLTNLNDTATRYNVTSLQLHEGENQNHHDILRKLDRHSQLTCNHKVFILDLSNKTLSTFLSKIIDVGMNRDGYSFIIGSASLEEQMFHPFRFGGAVFWGFDTINRRHPSLYNFMTKWNTRTQSEIERNVTTIFTIDVALMFDGIHLFNEAIKNVFQTYGKNIFIKRRNEFYNSNTTKGVYCANKPVVPFYNGKKVMDHIKKVKIEGFSGRVQFDSSGQRTNYTLRILRSEYKKGMIEVGSWSSEEGLQLKDKPKPSGRDQVKIVTSVIEPPFLQYKNNTNGKPGPHFEGFCKDLLDILHQGQHLSFDYHLILSPNNEYGVNSTGKWNGMIGQILRKEADIAIAPLTINKERQSVVDFTKPFMKTGVTIMIKRPDKEKPGVFSFKEPLAPEVWACIIAGFVAVSFIIFVVGRFSPFEWKSNSETGPSDDFSMMNCMWSSLGALMMQGSEIFPRSFSGRIAESAWWFFTLILISSYTANLAAFLTIEKLSIPISNVDELAAQTDIKYGCVRGGSTMTFFKDSKVYVYSKMWRFMKEMEDLGMDIFQPNNTFGWEKVKNSKGKFAFILEESLNDYLNQRKPCNTMKVGDRLNNFGYGVATQKNSPLSKNLNLEILDLRENGELIKLRRKWWVDKGQCVASGGDQGNKKSLSLSNVAGMFHILVAGLAIALLASVGEYFICLIASRKKKTYQVKRLEKTRMLEEKQGVNKGYQTTSPASNLIEFDSTSDNAQTDV